MSRAVMQEALDLRLAPVALGCWAAALTTLHTTPATGLWLTATAVLTCCAVLAFGTVLAGRAGLHGGAGLHSGAWRERGAGLEIGVALARGAEQSGGAVLREGMGPRGGAWWGRGVGVVLGRWRWVVAAALAGVACGAGVTSAHLAVRDSPEVAELVLERALAEVELTVRADPRAIMQGSWLIEADLLKVSGRFRTDARVVVLTRAPGWRSLLPGQSVMATVRFGPPRGGDLTAAVLSAPSAPELAGPAPWPQQAAGGLRAGLQMAVAPLPDRPGGLLPGLVVGDTSQLIPELEQQFRETGMTHLVAVSGSNVAIVVGFVVLLARWGRLRPQWTAAAAVVALAAFVVLVRPSPSVVRAAAMGAVGLLALASGRPKAALPALGAAIIALVLLDPELAGDPGFALSVSATGGLLFLAPPMRDALRRKGIPRGLAEALAVPASAQLACAPVIAGLSGSVSLIAVPANLLAVPAIAPATIIGVATTLIAPVWPAGAEFTAWLASWPAWWLVRIAELGSGAPGAEIPWPEGVGGGVLLAGVTLVGLLCVRRPAVRRVTVVITLGVAVVVVPVRLVMPGWPPPGWVVVACDVGQGDAMVLNAGRGTAVVVDTGPDAELLSACLSGLGVKEVPLLVLSHFHADHIGGIAAIKPRELLTSAFAEPAAGHAAVRRLGLPQREVTGPAVLTVGEVNLEVLYSGPLHGTRSDPNNNSVVLLATIRGVRVFLPGDAETEQQELLPRLTTDVLKVAHHGSSYQDSRLLDVLRPRVALVSVGAKNDYGHPNPAVLAALQRGGALIARTDQGGDIAVCLVDGRLLVAGRGTSG